jgi:hypothetical protein
VLEECKDKFLIIFVCWVDPAKDPFMISGPGEALRLGYADCLPGTSHIPLALQNPRLSQPPVQVISILTSSEENFYMADMEIILITKIRKFFTLLA